MAVTDQSDKNWQEQSLHHSHTFITNTVPIPPYLLWASAFTERNEAIKYHNRAWNWYNFRQKLQSIIFCTIKSVPIFHSITQATKREVFSYMEFVRVNDEEGISYYHANMQSSIIHTKKRIFCNKEGIRTLINKRLELHQTLTKHFWEGKATTNIAIQQNYMRLRNKRKTSQIYNHNLVKTCHRSVEVLLLRLYSK